MTVCMHVAVIAAAWLAPPAICLVGSCGKGILLSVQHCLSWCVSRAMWLLIACGAWFCQRVCRILAHSLARPGCVCCVVGGAQVALEFSAGNACRCMCCREMLVAGLGLHCGAMLCALRHNSSHVLVMFKAWKRCIGLCCVMSTGRAPSCTTGAACVHLQRAPCRDGQLGVGRQGAACGFP
ncbi:hypothetical protein COO60DRAFT_862496 [Scenedesmus sp. NREL 46B-D3]|nr:hypothetical protein COO60DRAFT_862496 [Scenedesmus sp. NREL 46B-D3]